MNDQNFFKGHMLTLSEIHGKELSETLNSIYWKTLEPFTDEECEAAFKELILSSKFFPKPADFLEILRGNKEDQASRAWIKVVQSVRKIGHYQSVKFDDPVIHSVFKFWGGWKTSADWKDSELKWKQKEFERLYVIMSGNGKHPSYLPGLIEIENSYRGYDMKVDVIEIGLKGKEKAQITA